MYILCASNSEVVLKIYFTLLSYFNISQYILRLIFEKRNDKKYDNYYFTTYFAETCIVDIYYYPFQLYYHRMGYRKPFNKFYAIIISFVSIVSLSETYNEIRNSRFCRTFSQ